MPDLIGRYLKKDRILLGMKAKKKPEAIRELAFLLEVSGEVSDFRRFLSALFQKEARFGSGVGDGVAIPHYRDEAIKEPVICLGISQQGIAWGKDEWGETEVVHLLVLIGWPYNHDDVYLKTVAEFARVLRQEGVRRKVLAAGTPDEALAALRVNGVHRAQVSC